VDINFFGYAEHVTIFSRMFTIPCCLVVGLGLELGLGLDLVWLVMHTYLYYFPLSLSFCLSINRIKSQNHQWDEIFSSQRISVKEISFFIKCSMHDVICVVSVLEAGI